MSHVEPEKTPLIPPRVRTALYMFVAFGGVFTFLLAGLAPVWFPPVTAKALVDTATVVTGALALVGGLVGYSYRPTR